MKVRISSQPSPNVLQRGLAGARSAFTLVEVMVAMTITVISLASVIVGYLFAARQAEWSAYSLAAQSLATQRMEQTRAASWYPRQSPVPGRTNDELVPINFPTVSTNILDLPVSGTNIAYATNFTMIADVPGAGFPLRMIQVDCVWSFRQRLFTNTIATYRAPDQ